MTAAEERPQGDGAASVPPASTTEQQQGDAAAAPQATPPVPAAAPADALPHLEKAWEFFRSMGSPKFHVAPMVDQSELPFRRLCRKYGATCAYTPMIHARLFCEDVKYRAENFTTNEGDHPLLVQFCANDPDFLVRAATLVQDRADAIDINFGCPQRIAKRGYYGAYLMDDLKLVERLVTSLVQGVKVPVTCKVRVFPKLADTLAYVRMIERCGCSVLAVHGRTREQKDNKNTRADWAQIKAVKQALRIPVLANGNIRTLQDALDLMAFTGADGVLSAESLLDDPALFSPCRLEPGGAWKPLDSLVHAREYLAMCVEDPVPFRMIKGHVHKICGPWLAEYTDLRDRLNRGEGGLEGTVKLVEEMTERVNASGRDHPMPKLSERAQARIAKEEAKKAAIEEQEREAAALQTIGVACTTCGDVPAAAKADVSLKHASGGEPEAGEAREAKKAKKAEDPAAPAEPTEA